jgi:hypothetical protein
MILKGVRLWAMGELDSNVHIPTAAAASEAVDCSGSEAEAAA